jgi:hypothetical protein
MMWKRKWIRRGLLSAIIAVGCLLAVMDMQGIIDVGATGAYVWDSILKCLIAIVELPVWEIAFLILIGPSCIVLFDWVKQFRISTTLTNFDKVGGLIWQWKGLRIYTSQNPDRDITCHCPKCANQLHVRTTKKTFRWGGENYKHRFCSTFSCPNCKGVNFTFPWHYIYLLKMIQSEVVRKYNANKICFSHTAFSPSTRSYQGFIKRMLAKHPLTLPAGLTEDSIES